MTGETLFACGLLLVTIILFVSDRLRLDVVAMLVILVLMLSGFHLYPCWSTKRRDPSREI